MPRISAASVLPMAMNRDMAKLWRKLSTVKTLRIHLSENPCGGNASVSPAEKEAATMIRNGPIRKASTRIRAMGPAAVRIICSPAQW